MTPEESKNSADILTRINKITQVTDLCNYENFDKMLVDNLAKFLDSMDEVDILYLLWIWAINDDFAKNSKFPIIVNIYSLKYQKLMMIMKNNNNFIMEYIKAKSQILRDATLELMHLHNDYDNKDLIDSINITTKIIEE